MKGITKHFLQDNVVLVINGKFNGCKAVVLKWNLDDIYTVKCIGKEIVLHAHEMELITA